MMRSWTLSVVMAMVISVGAIDQPARAAQIGGAPVRVDGDFAQTYLSVPSTGMWASVWVEKDDVTAKKPSPGTRPWTYLSYSAGGPAIPSTWGYCPIPAAAVTVTARGMEVHASAADLAGCRGTGAPTGPINVVWEKTHQYRSSWSGRDEVTFFDQLGTAVTFRFVGSTETTSANTSGTLFGIAFASTGSVGRSHDLQFTVIR